VLLSGKLSLGGDDFSVDERGFEGNGGSSAFFPSSRSSPRGGQSSSAQQQGFDACGERFSRKVFVGGLPPDIDEGKNIHKHICRTHKYNRIH
jgi:hypothetical protein